MANALTPSRVTLSEAAIHLTRNVALKISEIFRLEDKDEISLYVCFCFIAYSKKRSTSPESVIVLFSPELLAKLFLLWTAKQSNKRSGTRLKTESETGERLLRHALPISLLILRKKNDCFAVYFY